MDESYVMQYNLLWVPNLGPISLGSSWVPARTQVRGAHQRCYSIVFHYLGESEQFDTLFDTSKEKNRGMRCRCHSYVSMLFYYIFISLIARRYYLCDDDTNTIMVPHFSDPIRTGQYGQSARINEITSCLFSLQNTAQISIICV